MKTGLGFLVVLVLASAASFAEGQGSERRILVRGEISSSASMFGSWTVELSPNGGGISDTAEVKSDGTFEFQAASPGIHEIRVIGPSGKVIHQEMVIIDGRGQPLLIRINDPPNASRAMGGTVSLRQLTHKVPAPAQKAFVKGEQYAAKGDHQQAAEYFRQAVALDAEFVDAYNDLGAADAALGKLPEAAEDFQKAINIDPEHRLALPNLSIVLAKMKRLHEAGQVARRALKVAPGSGPIHFILAVSILADDGDSEEALDNLQRASTEVPKAHLVAADLLATRGRRQDAVRHLEEYLRTAPAGDSARPKAEALLTQLQH